MLLLLLSFSSNNNDDAVVFVAFISGGGGGGWPCQYESEREREREQSSLMALQQALTFLCFTNNLRKGKGKKRTSKYFTYSKRLPRGM